MTSSQEAVLAEVSKRLISYGWNERFIREWWQTPDRSLFEARTGEFLCPLEALCQDRFDMVHMSLDKTVRIYEDNLEKIEFQRKIRRDALLDEN